MKKSLFALAAVGAFAGAAQAQSSVTVYGILDVGYIGGNQRGLASAAGGATAKGNYNNIGSSAESTSRLGFRGTEDLGGGLRAFFTIETGLQPTNATVSTFNNRQTFVGLGQKGIGQISFGTQYTPIHTAIGQTSAGQQNNMVGDVIYPIAPNNNGNTTGFAAAAGASNTDAYTIRTSNMLFVRSDNFAGFVGSAFYTMADSDTTARSSTSGGVNNNNGWGVGLNYTWQKLLVTANYQSLNSRQTANGTTIYNLSTYGNNSVTTTSATLNSAALWTGASGGVNVRDNQFYVAATYDFGVLKAYAQYINRKATSQLDSSNFLSRTAQQIGVRGFVTKTIEGWASVGNGRWDSFGATHPTVNFTGYQVGSNYWLSKRTNMYAIFGSTSQSSSTNQAQPSIGANNYAVGVRHTF